MKNYIPLHPITNSGYDKVWAMKPNYIIYTPILLVILPDDKYHKMTYPYHPHIPWYPIIRFPINITSYPNHISNYGYDNLYYTIVNYNKATYQKLSSNYNQL